MQKKFHIIGGPGSGKPAGVTLFKDFGFPHLDLDEIFWDREAKTFDKKADPKVRDAALLLLVLKCLARIRG